MTDDVAIPALLRAARGAYARSIQDSLAAAGFDDVPRNGPFLLGGMTNRGGSVAELISGLDVTRQAASQLIDTLVLRGYLTRENNPDDRRRITISLTDRGRAAGEAVGAGIQAVDEQVAGRLTHRELGGLRAGLNALAEIRAGR